jgi:hypothetical protein
MAERNITLQFRAVAPADPTYQKQYGKFPVIVVPVSEAKQTISTFHKKGFQLLSSATSPAIAERTITGIAKERQEDVALATPFFEVRGDIKKPTQAEKRVRASLTEDVRYLSPDNAEIKLKETPKYEELNITNNNDFGGYPFGFKSKDSLTTSKDLSFSDIFTKDPIKREQIKKKLVEKGMGLPSYFKGKLSEGYSFIKDPSKREQLKDNILDKGRSTAKSLFTTDPIKREQIKKKLSSKIITPAFLSKSDIFTTDPIKREQIKKKLSSSLGTSSSSKSDIFTKDLSKREQIKERLRKKIRTGVPNLFTKDPSKREQIKKKLSDKATIKTPSFISKSNLFTKDPIKREQIKKRIVEKSISIGKTTKSLFTRDVLFTEDPIKREQIKKKLVEKANIGTASLVTGITAVEASTLGRGTQFVTKLVPTQFGKGLVEGASGLIGFIPFTVPRLLLSPKQEILKIGAGAKESFQASKTRFAGQLTGALATGIGFKRFTPRVIGEVRTFTRPNKVAIEDLVPEKVLSGEKRFPEAPRSKHAELFVEGGSRLPDETPRIKTGAGFHTTAYPAGVAGAGEVLAIGKSEFKGLYISPYLSPNFLRILQSNKLFSAETGKGTIFGKPTVYRVYPKDVKEVPSSVAGSIPKTSRFLQTKGERGTAYVPKLKTEAEAILIEKTGIEGSKTPYYTKVGGVKVPIDIIKTIETKPTTFLGKVRQRTFIKSLSYEAPTTFAVTTPTSLLVSSVSASRYSSPKYSIPSVVSSPISSGVKSSSPLVSGSSFVGYPSSFVGTPSRSFILKPPRSSPSLLFSKTTTAPPYPTSSPPSTPPSTTFGSSFPIKKQKKRKLDKKVKKSVITTPFDPKYTFSIEARELGIKGKPSKSAVKTGLGIRPLRR